ncbi:MAG: hypothetical protein ACK5RL_20880 [Acidimicrobiales bacterium]
MAVSDHDPEPVEPVELVDPEQEVGVPARQSPVALLAGLVALGLVAMALVVLGRPAAEVEPVVPSTQVIPSPPSSVPAVVGLSGGARRVHPFPPFDEHLPRVGGVLSGFTSDGWIVSIDRAAPGPSEVELWSPVAGPGEPVASVLHVEGSPPVAFARQVVIEDDAVVVGLGDRETRVPLNRVLPQGGSVLLVQLSTGTVPVEATAIDVVLDDHLAGEGHRDGGTPEDGPGPVTAERHWQVQGPPVTVWGRWADQLLVGRADRTWLLSRDGAAQPVTVGQVLSFDGRWLVSHDCDHPTDCTIAVGTPDDPHQRIIPLPAPVAGLDVGAWGRAVAVSPDGVRLATAVDNGVLSLPLLVELDTGAYTLLGDGMNPDTPVVWAPDGSAIAYTYSDDVMVWPVAQPRSWRVSVDRPVEGLVWG